jgi:hypothetical protein
MVMLLLAKVAGAAECPNHCTEERIEQYAKAEATTLRDMIRSTGFICDDPKVMGLNDAVPGRVRYYVMCMGGPLESPVLIYTVDITAKRTVVYPGQL